MSINPDHFDPIQLNDQANMLYYMISNQDKKNSQDNNPQNAPDESSKSGVPDEDEIVEAIKKLQLNDHWSSLLAGTTDGGK